jgi:hypothetical protein
MPDFRLLGSATPLCLLRAVKKRNIARSGLFNDAVSISDYSSRL